VRSLHDEADEDLNPVAAQRFASADSMVETPLIASPPPVLPLLTPTITAPATSRPEDLEQDQLLTDNFASEPEPRLVDRQLHATATPLRGFVPPAAGEFIGAVAWSYNKSPASALGARPAYSPREKGTIFAGELCDEDPGTRAFLSAMSSPDTRLPPFPGASPDRGSSLSAQLPSLVGASKALSATPGPGPGGFPGDDSRPNTAQVHGPVSARGETKEPLSLELRAQTARGPVPGGRTSISKATELPTVSASKVSMRGRGGRSLGVRRGPVP